MQLLFIVLPIFVLIGLGYLLRRLGIITRDGISHLNRFAYYVALPAIIVMSFWNIDWLDSATQATLLINTVLLIGLSVVLLAGLRLLPINPRLQAGIFAASLVGNTVYMGFPIGQRALSEGGFDLYVAAATPHLVLGITLSVLAIEWLLAGSQRPMQYLKDFFLNPLILSLLAGIALSLSSVSGALVELVREVGGLLAATASPVALVALGAFLHGIFKPHLARLALFTSALKLFVLPLAIYGGSVLFGADPAIVAGSVLAAAMPTAVTSFVIAERYHAAPELVATTLCVSTVASLGTISLLLWLFI